MYKNWICPKRRRNVIPVSRLVFNHTLGDATVCDVASSPAKATAAVRAVHFAANGIELFVQTLVVFQKTPFLDAGIVT